MRGSIWSICLTSHSQTVSTCHLSFSSSAIFRASRSIFLANFGSQNVTRSFGVEAKRQLGCRCQKQPCIKIAFLRAVNARSGEPGKVFMFVRNRYPAPCSAQRTAISGFVRSRRTERIIFDLIGSISNTIDTSLHGRLGRLQLHGLASLGPHYRSAVRAEQSLLARSLE